LIPTSFAFNTSVSPTGYYFGTLKEAGMMGYTSTGRFFSPKTPRNGVECGPAFTIGDRVGVLVEACNATITFYLNDKVVSTLRNEFVLTSFSFAVAISSSKTSAAIKVGRTRPP
jgi:hypothetical protein